MNTLMDNIALLIRRELESAIKEIELFPNDDLLWNTVPGITNSAGNLALHVCGNLKHFIGAVLGKTGYTRDREAEFNTLSGRRTDVVREINDTINVITTVLPTLTEETLATDFPEAVMGVTVPCDRFLVHLSAHAAFHLGQAGYLRRILTGDSETTGCISVQELA